MKEYRIKLKYTYNGLHERTTNAIYGDGLSLDYTKESNEEFFRTKLSGQITFANDDYNFIMVGTPFDQRFEFLMEINENGSWYTYFEGYFYKTDCKINEDDKLITVEPTPDDLYTDFLGAIDKEVDLIKLAPRITPVMLDKRPCLQLYAAGQTTIGCILGNMYWEQECEAITDVNELTDTYHFADWGCAMTVTIGGTHSPSTPEVLSGIIADPENFTLSSGTTELRSQLSGTRWGVSIHIGGTAKFYNEITVADLTFPRRIELYGINGGSGTCTLDFAMQHFFARLICDVDSIAGSATLDLPYNDMAGANRNYKKAAKLSSGGDLQITINTTLSNQPTEWGLYQSGKYYTSPLAVSGIWLPICRSLWGRGSFWISQSTSLQIIEENARKATVLNDAYRLFDVLKVLIENVAPSLTWGGVNTSEFLFKTNPLDANETFTKYIVPKSNILNINYTEPAQQAKITLREVLDMLRVCYRCYWYLEYNALHIEHIEFFRRGHSYSSTASVAVDLTTDKVARNGKTWAYLTSKYSYDKIEMPFRYEFGWMDDQTEQFNGLPMDMQSNFVDKGRVEKFVANKFDADIDYLMMNPSSISKDGFVILDADDINIIVNPITVTGTLIVRTFTLMSYDAKNGETVDVVYGCGGDGTVWAADENGNPLAEVGGWNPLSSGSEISSYWELPPGTAQIIVEVQNQGDYFTLKELVPSMEKVVYWQWQPDPNDSATIYNLQNGTLSFPHLQRWYAYDMPCQNYVIGNDPKTAIGVSKNKVQEVILPTDGYFDVQELIETNLGNGKIRKLSINLSSKIGKATLEYDTQ